jgi:hypothetical protein
MATRKDKNIKDKKEKGRPPLFKTPEDLQEKIDAYFDGGCNMREVALLTGVVQVKTPTITGLAYYLGFESRQSFYDYGEKPEFSYTIKRARLRLEMMYEEKLDDAKPTGAIFALKNLGWTDKIENTHSINLIEPITGIKIIRDGAGA